MARQPTDLSLVFKALGDDSRLRLLLVLMQGRFNVNELRSILRLGQSRVSRHLRQLLDAGLVRLHREGTWSYYDVPASVDDPFLRAQLKVVRSFGHSLSAAAGDEERRHLCLEARRQRSRAFHDRVAPRWDELRRELCGDAPLTERILARVPAGVVADLGCGPGELLVELAQKHERVIGVDSSAAMLAEASHRVAALGRLTSRVDLRLGALEHLPVADSEANTVVLNLVLHHVAEPKVVLREAARALGDGGCLVLCDLLSHPHEWMRERYGDFWLGFSPQQIRQYVSQAGLILSGTETFDDTPEVGTLLTVAHKPVQTHSRANTLKGPTRQGARR